MVEPSAMEKAVMDPDDGCIYDPPYYANYIYKYFGFDSVSFDRFKICVCLSADHCVRGDLLNSGSDRIELVKIWIFLDPF